MILYICLFFKSFIISLCLTPDNFASQGEKSLIFNGLKLNLCLGSVTENPTSKDYQALPGLGGGKNTSLPILVSN